MDWKCHPNDWQPNSKYPHLWAAPWWKDKCWTTIFQIQGQTKKQSHTSGYLWWYIQASCFNSQGLDGKMLQSREDLCQKPLESIEENSESYSCHAQLIHQINLVCKSEAGLKHHMRHRRNNRQEITSYKHSENHIDWQRQSLITSVSCPGKSCDFFIINKNIQTLYNEENPKNLNFSSP